MAQTNSPIGIRILQGLKKTLQDYNKQKKTNPEGVK